MVAFAFRQIDQAWGGGGKAFKDAGATIIGHRRVRERLAVIKDPFTVPPDQTF